MAEPTPQWKIFNLLSTSNIRQIQQQTKQVQSTIQRANSILKQADSLLDTVQSFVSILKRIESTVQQSFYAILDVVVSMVEDMLNSVRSTGFYALDLTSYHLQSEYPSFYDDGSELGGAEWWAPFEKATLGFKKGSNVIQSAVDQGLQSLCQQFYTQLKVYMVTMTDKDKVKAWTNQWLTPIEQYLKSGNRNALSSFKLQDVANAIDEEHKRNGGKGSKSANVAYLMLQKVFTGFRYKQETYYDFVDTIVAAFLDEKDRPGRPILHMLGEVKESKSLDYKTSISGEENTEVKKFQVIHSKSDKTIVNADYLQSGRPVFENKGDYVKVFIVGFALPSIDDVLTIIDTMKRLVEVGKDSGMDVWNSLQSFAKKDTIGIIDTIRRIEVGDIPSLSFMADDLSRGEEPNFIGINGNLLLKDFFTYVDNFLKWTKQLTLKFTSSIFDSIENLAGSFRAIIKTLQQLLDLIMDIVMFINSLLTLTRCFTLTIETNNGIAGVIEQLRSAQPFIKNQMTFNRILDKFDLSMYPDARLFIAEGATSKMDLILNVAKYQEQITADKTSAQNSYADANNAYEALQATLASLQVVYNQVKAFEVALSASSYYTIKNAMNAQLAIYDASILAKDEEYRTELQADNSRAWLANQITLFTNELIDVPDENASPFNVSNYNARTEVQGQKDALVAQHSDPNAPLIPDYDSQIAGFNNLLAIYATQKADHDSFYTDKKNRFNGVKGIVDAFCEAHPVTSYAGLAAYDSKVTEVQGEIGALKAARQEEYDDYVAARSANLNLQTNKQLEIEAKYLQIQTDLQELSQKRGEKAYYEAINQLEYGTAEDVTSTVLSDTDKAWTPGAWTGMYVVIESDVQIAITGNTATELQFTGNLNTGTNKPYRIISSPVPSAILDRIDELNAEIASLNASITILRGEIVSLQNAIIVLDNNMSAYDTQAVKDQENKFYEMTCYQHWRASENLRLQKQDIVNERASYKVGKELELSTLLYDLIDQYIPSLQDESFIAIYDLLWRQEGFDEDWPDSTRVQNAIAKIQGPGGQLYLLQAKKEIAASEVTQLTEILSKIPTDKLNSYTQELLGELDKDEFNPNERMYYGGFLVCFGWPGAGTFTNSVVEMTSAAQDEIKVVNGQVKVLEKDIQQIRGLTKQIFSKILK